MNAEQVGGDSFFIPAILTARAIALRDHTGEPFSLGSRRHRERSHSGEDFSRAFSGLAHWQLLVPPALLLEP
jgi:hypothetical protein